MISLFPKKLSRRLGIILNGSMHAVSQVIRTIVAFVTIPIILGYLGKEAFGIWMIALSFLTLIGFFQGGVAGSLINLIAQSKNDFKDISDTLSSAISLTLILGLIISAISTSLAFLCPWEKLFASAGIISERDIILLILVLGCGAGFSLVSAVPKFALIGNQQAYWAHSIDIIAALISAVLVISAALTKQPIWVLALAFSFGRQLPLFILGVAFLTFKIGIKKFLKFSLDPKTTRLLLGTGGLLTIIQISHALANHADLTLIGIFNDLGGAADYALTQKLFTLPIIGMSFVNLALWPVFAKAQSDGDTDWIMKIFRRNIIITSLLACIFAITMGLSLNWILKLWVGDKIHIGSLLILGMVLKTIMIVPISNMSNLLRSLDLFKFIAVLSACMVIVNVPVSIWLIKKIGPAGAIFGTVISYAIFFAIPYLTRAPKLIRETLQNRDR